MSPIFFWTNDESFVEGNLHGSGTALLVISRTRKIGEDAAHHARGNREEVGAILPFDCIDVNQAKIDFVDQSGGLQGVTPASLDITAVGEAVKLPAADRSERSSALSSPVPHALRS